MYVNYGRAWSIGFCLFYFGFLCSILAYRMSMNFVAWFFVGLTFGFLGLAILIFRSGSDKYIENGRTRLGS